MGDPRIRKAQSCAVDARRAAQEFHAGVAQPDMELVVFFCSSEYDLDALAAEMRRLLGVDADSLGSAHFAAAPVLVKVAGTDHVRSIQSANPDRSLNFFCAIDRGLVLRVGQGLDLSNNLEQVFDRIDADMGTPQLVLTFDCALRAQEVSRSRANDRVDAVFRSNSAVGFNTYGEQFRGAHVNQTLTGIAIGHAAPSPEEQDHA